MLHPQLLDQRLVLAIPESEVIERFPHDLGRAAEAEHFDEAWVRVDELLVFGLEDADRRAARLEDLAIADLRFVRAMAVKSRSIRLPTAAVGTSDTTVAAALRARMRSAAGLSGSSSRRMAIPRGESSKNSSASCAMSANRCGLIGPPFARDLMTYPAGDAELGLVLWKEFVLRSRG